MAETPEQALADHFKAIGDRQEIRIRDALHLPFVHFGGGLSGRAAPDGSAGVAWLPQVVLWTTEHEVPEDIALPAGWPTELRGTYCTLDAYELVLGNESKRAYKVAGTRYNSDGSEINTFEAIYTVVNVDGDWRVALRNPITVTRSE